MELELWSRSWTGWPICSSRAGGANSGSSEIGIGAARTGAAGTASAPALALVLQVVWGGRDERSPLPALGALARRVGLVRLAGGDRTGSACALSLLPAYHAIQVQRRQNFPVKRPRSDTWTNFVFPLTPKLTRPRDLAQRWSFHLIRVHLYYILKDKNDCL